MKAILTVIVPVYNAGKYLRQCLESILKQSIALEVIVVNDNSTDNSLDIINEYCLKFDDFKIINNESRLGAGESRNIAIKQVTTPYLTFVDADDFISQDAYEKCFNHINEFAPELLIYNWHTYREDNIAEPENIHQQNTSDDYYIDSISDAPNLVFSTPSWNKIYHRNLYKYLDFSSLLFDDNVAVVNAVVNAKGIFHTSKADYFYRKTPTSTTENITPKHALDLIESVRQLNNLNNTHVSQLIIKFVCDILFWIYKYNWSISDEIKIVAGLKKAINITQSDLDKFKDSFPLELCYTDEILDVQKMDAKAFIATYKYFNKLSKVNSIANLYIDCGRGFNEEDKLSIRYMPDESNVLTFDLSAYSNIFKLRFDPLEGDFIKCKINNINVGDVNSQLTEDEYHIFTNLDPWFIINDFNQNELTIDFSMKILTNNDLAELFERGV